MNPVTSIQTASESSSLRFPAGLYGVTPDSDDVAAMEKAIRKGVAFGLTAVQLRLKTVPHPQRLKVAQALRDVCRELSIVFIVNDDWQLAREVEADGVHMGRDDGNVFAARKALGPDFLMGVSCYADIERARLLLDVPVDYVAFGAMYASGTKPQAPPAPHDILTQARRLCEADCQRWPADSRERLQRAAVVAIGGINASNAGALTQAGADSLAVIGALFAPADPLAEQQGFARLWSGHPNLSI